MSSFALRVSQIIWAGLIACLLFQHEACVAEQENAPGAQGSAGVQGATLPAAGVAAGEGEAMVPDVSVFGGVEELQAVLRHAGLKWSMKPSPNKTPSKDKEFRAASQNPAPGTRVKKGSIVQISIYQKFGGVPDASAAGKIRVPDLSAFDSVEEMKAALSHLDLQGAFSPATGSPPAGSKTRVASQSPGAGIYVDKDAVVSVTVYPKPGDMPGVGIPDLSGLTWEEAQARLALLGLRIGGAEMVKPPSADKANRIFGQEPAAGARIPESKVVIVRVYDSSLASSTATPDPSAGPTKPPAPAGPTPPSGTKQQTIDEVPGAPPSLIGAWSGKWIVTNSDGKREEKTYFLRFKEVNGKVVPSSWTEDGAGLVVSKGFTIDVNGTEVKVTFTIDRWPTAKRHETMTLRLSGSSLVGESTFELTGEKMAKPYRETGTLLLTKQPEK